MSDPIAFDDPGYRRPILFIHGFPLTRAMWAGQVAGLQGVARPIALDLPGHGSSPARADGHTIDDLADACVHLLDQRGVTEPAVICGLSMGGYVAFALWRRHPQRVAGLVLCATRAGADTAAGRAGRDTLAAAVAERGIEAAVEAMRPKLLAPATYQERPELVARVEQIMRATSSAGAIADLAAMRDRPDSTPTLATITCPTLVIHGRDDQVMPVAEAETIAAGVPHARLVVLDRAGHLPNLEQPERFNAALSLF